MRVVIDISEHDKEWIGNAYGIPQEINTKIAEAIINAEPCQPEPHWIPVTERLPETELHHPGHGIGDYLKSDMVAVSGDFDYGDKVWIACYCDDLDGKTYWSDMDANTLYNVIAWMPLPEPYKGVTNGRD